jgi:hypothetical protein
MVDRDQLAGAPGTERQVLDGRRAVADRGEHLGAGQHQLDRAACHPGRQRGQDDVRPGPEPGPERAADERREHPDRGLGQPQRDCERGADKRRALRRIVHGQQIAVPGGDGREQPQRIVGLGRGGVRAENVSGTRKNGPVGNPELVTALDLDERPESLSAKSTLPVLVR